MSSMTLDEKKNAREIKKKIIITSSRHRQEGERMFHTHSGTSNEGDRAISKSETAIGFQKFRETHFGGRTLCITH